MVEACQISHSFWTDVPAVPVLEMVAAAWQLVPLHCMSCDFGQFLSWVVKSAVLEVMHMHKRSVRVGVSDEVSYVLQAVH